MLPTSFSPGSAPTTKRHRQHPTRRSPAITATAFFKSSSRLRMPCIHEAGRMEILVAHGFKCKKRGRPCDDRAHQRVPEAVRDHPRKEGLCGLVMEGIARRVGVGKQTHYRWWPRLAEATLEALAAGASEYFKLRLHILHDAIPALAG